MSNKIIYKQRNTLLFALEYPPFKGGVANYYGSLVKYWPDNKIEALTGQKLIKPHWLFGLWRLWRAVKNYNIQTVLVGHILPLGTLTWLLSRMFGIKFDYIVFLHGMDLSFAMRTQRKKWLARRILRDAAKVICVNSYVANMAGKIVEESKIAVVNPGIEVRSLRPPATRRAGKADPLWAEKYEGRSNELRQKYNLQNKTILLQVGRLVKRKGYDKALEALPAVLKQVPGIVYVIIGSGPELESMKSEVGSKKLEENVRFITNAADEERDAWYELCDIFIMPSRDLDGDFEGFGIVYLEANAHGKPVIAGDSGGVRDAVKDGVNGLLVNPESAEEIAAAVVKLCKNDGLGKKLGEQGREWVKNFSWEKQADKIVKLLNC